MVHAVNPVGMKEYRRCNENNVDLNRNGIFVSDDETTMTNDNVNGGDTANNEADTSTSTRGDGNGDGVYHSFKEFLAKRDPNVAGYDDFRHLFVPGMDDDSDVDVDIDIDDPTIDPLSLSLYETTIGYYIKAIPALWKHGILKLKIAMVSGQYHDPEGLNYGGQEWQPSVRRLLDFFVRDRSEFFRDSASVIWIDVHTGLGPFGRDTIHYDTRSSYNKNAHVPPEEEPEIEREEDLRTAAAATPVVTALGDYLTTAYSISKDEEMTSTEALSGYNLATGLILQFMADSYLNLLQRSANNEISSIHGDGSKSGFFVMQEFGTLPTILVGRALILDNVLYQIHKRRSYYARRSQNSKKEGGAQQHQQDFSYRSPFLKHAFYPQSTEWRSSIVRRGVALFLQSMEYIETQRKTRVR